LTCIRYDHGPEFIAAAIRDWCRFVGAGTASIEPGSPWQNPFVVDLLEGGPLSRTGRVTPAAH